MKISQLYRKLFCGSTNWVEVTDNLQWVVTAYSRMFYKIGPEWKPRLPEKEEEKMALEYFCKRILSELDRNENTPKLSMEESVEKTEKPKLRRRCMKRAG